MSRVSEEAKDRNREKDRARNAIRRRDPAYKERQKGYVRMQARRRRLSKYGLCLGDAQEILGRQHGQCAICGVSISLEPKPGSGSAQGRACVDHCHTSGRVRGLLCGKCNAGIGLLGDTAERVAKAFRYLLDATGKVE